MNAEQNPQYELSKSQYDKSNCSPGIIHVGVGAFHRAHQAVYIDKLLEIDNSWGIIGVNLREQESSMIATLKAQNHDYVLKTMSPTNEICYSQISSIVDSVDWSQNPEAAAEAAAMDSIHIITMTVTESGYYLTEDGQLDLTCDAIQSGLKGEGSCIYTYLRAALTARKSRINKPITLLSCDNLRHNGHWLKSGFEQFLLACEDHGLLEWVKVHVTFPCCMVDRITPRLDPVHAQDVKQQFAVNDALTVMGESFIQWVIEDNFASAKPPLDKVGVQIVEDVEPFEESKIRVLNGGHSLLVYIGALKGYTHFDEIMRDDELVEMFHLFETNEVIPALGDSPLNLYDYRDLIASRFGNPNIADTVERISADGVSKFPIFILPTVVGSYQLGNKPTQSINGIAAWYVFMRHQQQNKLPFAYMEPKWADIESFIAQGQEEAFAQNDSLWGQLPQLHPRFVSDLVNQIELLEQRFPSH